MSLDVLVPSVECPFFYIPVIPSCRYLHKGLADSQRTATAAPSSNSHCSFYSFPLQNLPSIVVCIGVSHLYISAQ